jgi:hypothetical protein
LSFGFEKLSSNSFKSQRWRAFMITANDNSHHWQSLKSPACGKDHRWRLSNVTRQWWPTAGGCLSLARNEMMPSGCQIFPPSATVVPNRRRPTDHPVDLHERPAVVRQGPAPSPNGPPPSSARARAVPFPADRRRAVFRGRPVDRRPPPPAPSPLFPTRMMSSTPRAASPTAGQEPPPTALPPPTAPPPPPSTALTPPLGTDTSSPHRSARMEAGDGPTAQQRQPRLGWFFSFFQNAITCVKNVDK